MGLIGTINVRLDAGLKDHGMQVFERSGISVSDAVRKLFEHVEHEQAVPEWMLDDAGADVQRRRKELRHMVKELRSLPRRKDAANAMDPRAEYRQHLVDKHGFTGVRE